MLLLSLIRTTERDIALRLLFQRNKIRWKKVKLRVYTRFNLRCGGGGRRPLKMECRRESKRRIVASKGLPPKTLTGVKLMQSKIHGRLSLLSSTTTTLSR